MTNKEAAELLVEAMASNRDFSYKMRSCSNDEIFGCEIIVNVASKSSEFFGKTIILNVRD